MHAYWIEGEGGALRRVVEGRHRYGGRRSIFVFFREPVITNLRARGAFGTLPVSCACIFFPLISSLVWWACTGNLGRREGGRGCFSGLSTFDTNAVCGIDTNLGLRSANRRIEEICIGVLCSFVAG